MLLALANLQIEEMGEGEAAKSEEGKEDEDAENGTANGSKKQKGKKGEYDLKHLDETIRMLREDDNICVDPGSTLKNVTIIDTPAPNKNCPCGSRKKFKRCCQDKYDLAR